MRINPLLTGQVDLAHWSRSLHISLRQLYLFLRAHKVNSTAVRGNMLAQSQAVLSIALRLLVITLMGDQCLLWSLQGSRSRDCQLFPLHCVLYTYLTSTTTSFPQGSESKLYSCQRKHASTTPTHLDNNTTNMFIYSYIQLPHVVKHLLYFVCLKP